MIPLNVRKGGLEGPQKDLVPMNYPHLSARPDPALPETAVEQQYIKTSTQSQEQVLDFKKESYLYLNDYASAVPQAVVRVPIKPIAILATPLSSFADTQARPPNIGFGQNILLDCNLQQIPVHPRPFYQFPQFCQPIDHSTLLLSSQLNQNSFNPHLSLHCWNNPLQYSTVLNNPSNFPFFQRFETPIQQFAFSQQQPKVTAQPTPHQVSSIYSSDQAQNRLCQEPVLNKSDDRSTDNQNEHKVPFKAFSYLKVKDQTENDAVPRNHLDISVNNIVASNYTESNNHKPSEKLPVTQASIALIPSLTQEPQSKGCNCKRAKCLKLYCKCFSTKGYCSNKCLCSDCHNNENHKELRELIILEVLEKNPNAFVPKYKNALQNETQMLHSLGCTCKSSSCMKEYCECFRGRVGCSPICKCINCKNKRVDLTEEMALKVKDNKIKKRKKHNIVYDLLFQKIEKQTQRSLK